MNTNVKICHKKYHKTSKATCFYLPLFIMYYCILTYTIYTLWEYIADTPYLKVPQMFRLCCRQDLHPIVIVKENSNIPTILNDSGRN